jgi:DNA-binding CsgD family transcriptional regulator
VVLSHFLSRPTPGARLISDFLTRREFHRLSLYGEFFAPLGVEDQLTVLVSALSSGTGVGVSVDRGRRSFDDRDRRLMSSLQPHLAAARNNSIRFSAALSQQSRSVEPWDHPKLDRLTSRQREILAQLSSGGTNAQIALELDISVGTVRKHVEHILRRLDVPTRTAAAVCYIAGSAPTHDSVWTASISAMLSDRDGRAALTDDTGRSGCDDGARLASGELPIRPGINA